MELEKVYESDSGWKEIWEGWYKQRLKFQVSLFWS